MLYVKIDYLQYAYILKKGHIIKLALYSSVFSTNISHKITAGIDAETKSQLQCLLCEYA